MNKQKLLLLGCGAVGQNVLGIFSAFRNNDDFSKIIIIDKIDMSMAPAVIHAVTKGAKFVQAKVTKENYSEILSQYVKENDIIVDLSVTISTTDLVCWALSHSVHYVNTALELWEESNSQDWTFEERTTKDCRLQERTLHRRQYETKEAIKLLSNQYQSTCVLDHGMNPGLVSHFTKAALLNIANNIKNPPKELFDAIKSRNFARIAMYLQVAVIHISEQDNQVCLPGRGKKQGEFLSTWSCEGFVEEGLEPTQLGFGTHEKQIPRNAVLPVKGEKNQIFIPVAGIDFKMITYVPGYGEIVGYNIPHSEASTISSFLTVYEEGEAIYRPTCHYVYQPPSVAVESWAELLKQPAGNRTLDNFRVLQGCDLKEGHDAVGVLLICENGLDGKPSANPQSYWAGSIVSVEENLKKSGILSAPTTVQVAVSILSLVEWIYDGNTDKGLIWPESVDHDYILNRASPWLGDVVFGPVSGWAPKSTQFFDFCCDKRVLD